MNQAVTLSTTRNCALFASGSSSSTLNIAHRKVYTILESTCSSKIDPYPSEVQSFACDWIVFHLPVLIFLILCVYKPLDGASRPGKGVQRKVQLGFRSGMYPLGIASGHGYKLTVSYFLLKSPPFSAMLQLIV